MKMMTQRQMREGRHYESIMNSIVKREGNKEYVYLFQCGCGCGVNSVCKELKQVDLPKKKVVVSPKVGRMSQKEWQNYLEKRIN